MPDAKTVKTNTLYFSEKLKSRFGNLAEFPCTVVEAPMGYGKTTAVREFLYQLDARIIWLNVYENGSGDFWNRFCSALGALDRDFAESLRTMGIPNDYKLFRETAELILGLRQEAPVFLVIDDYHLVRSSDVDRFMDVLLRSMPAWLHLVVITRNAFLENSRDLRLKRIISRIGMDDLQLTAADIADYYRQCGIRLTVPEQERLFEFSEGWVSALYLIMLDYVQSGVIVTNSDIAELVRETVYTPLTDEMKAFLSHICIFDEFSREQASFMWQKENAGLLLDTLMKGNAFITRSLPTGRYHLHNIFSSCIGDVFSSLPDADKKALWQRAGDWHALKEEYSAAMDFYFKASDFECLLLAFDKDRSYAYDNQRKEKTIQYLSACPEEIRRRHHQAYVVYARLLFLTNKQAQFAQFCPQLYKEITEDQTLDEGKRNSLLGEFQLIVSFSKYNSIGGMTSHFVLADRLMTAPSTILDTVSDWTLSAPSILYMFFREKDSLDREIGLMNTGIALYSKETGGHGLGAAEVFEAEVYAMRGELDTSDILLHKGMAKSEEAKQWSIVLCAMFQQSRNALYRGDYETADGLMRAQRDMLKRNNKYALLYTADMCQAYLHLLLGQTESTPTWIEAGNLEGAKLLFTAVPALNLVQSRLLLEQRQLTKLIGLSEQFGKVAGVFPNLLCQIYLHIHLAAAYHGLFRHDDAVRSLRTALELALPDRVYMPFAENSCHIMSLLADRGSYPEFIGGIEAIEKCSEAWNSAVSEIKTRYFGTPASKLTEREEEVAALAALGMPNREIAHQLFVSENTVKAHLKSTFEKLNIKSRAQLADSLKQFRT